MYDLIVIGCGPAGMTAAIYAKRANLNVLLLDKLAPGGQIVNTHEIENYTGTGRINGAELAIRMYEHTMELNIPMEYGTVESIGTDGMWKLVKCTEGNNYKTKSVIIATGTKPRILHVENEDNFIGNGISFCAICDGAQYHGKDVIVIGGGNSAVEEAIYLASIVNHLTVVTLFNLTADPIACDKLRTLENVTVMEYHDILSFNSGDKFTGLTAKSTETGEITIVLADGAFEYIGLEPTTKPFELLGILNDYGYIKTNANMETEIDGILAAGDVIEKNLRQVITACSDGAIAAQNAAKYVRNTNV